MKLKIIAILAIMLVSGALVTGGSIYAYFSDVEAVNGNEYTSGTLDLNLGGSGATPAVIGPVYPGWGTAQYPSSVGSTATITVSNTGNINGMLYLNITSLTNNDNGIADPEGKYNLVPTDGGDITGGAGEGELQQYLYVSVTFGSTQVLAPTIISSVGSDGIQLGGLPASGSQTVTITYYVPSTVGNVIQSDSVAFNLVFNLEQSRTIAV
jgi:predicted ribosomally synthesized peptide with SipW-like signal peptide